MTKERKEPIQVKPNTVLPNGAKLITPRKVKLPTWVEMEVDAEVERHGIIWYRVRGGMGFRNDCEDWVANFPVGMSVHDYQWRAPRWGSISVNSFDEAIDHAVRRALHSGEIKAKRLKKELAVLTEALDTLQEKRTNG
jgi:hypothetical protein